MPVKAPPPPVPVAFNWTGFYLGANVGGAWFNRDVNDTLFPNLNWGRRNNGGIWGGQVGYNRQFDRFVLGIEGQFDGSANNNRGLIVNTPNANFAITDGNRWVSTVAARFGIANDHWLFYGKLGGGWVGAKNFTITNLNNGNFVTFGVGSRSGPMGGLGVEYAFTNNWTVKAEFEYIGLGSRTFIVPANAPILANDVFNNRNRNVEVFKVGFNYLFNTAPVVARY